MLVALNSSHFKLFLMPYSASFPLSTPYLLAFSLFLILTGYGRFSSFVVLPFALLGTGYIRSLGIFEPTINNNLFLCLVRTFLEIWKVKLTLTT